MREGRASAGPVAVVLLAGLLLRLVIAYVWLPGEGLGSDLRLFTHWAQVAADYGTGGFYEHAGFADYPPGYLSVLYLVGWFGNLVAGLTGQTSTEVIGGLIKLPAIAADLGIAAVLYRAASGWSGRRAGLVAASLFLFIPVTWYDSALWGQVDAVGTLVLLGAVLLLVAGWSEPAVALAVLAALTKPQYVIVLGVVGIVLLRRHLLWPGSGPVPQVGGWTATLDRRLGGWLTARQGIERLISSAAVGVVVGLVVILPFDLPTQAPADLAGVPIVGYVAGLLSVIGSAAAYYDVLTVNAFNPWALVGPNPLSHALAHDYQWTYDSLVLFDGISAVRVGAILAILAALAVAAVALLRDERRTLVLAVTVLAVAFFVLPTRVHERYLFPAFAVGALLAATSVRWRWWYVALGLANGANLHAILTLPFRGYGTPAIQALPLGDLLRQDWAVAIAALVITGLFVAAFVAMVRAVPWPGVSAPIEAFGRAAPAPQRPVPRRGPTRRAAAARRRTQGTPARGRAALGQALAALAAWISAAVDRLLGPIRRRLDSAPPPTDRSAELAREGGGRFDRRDLAIALALLLVVFGMRTWRLETPTNMYFDEDLHARSAMEFLQDWRYGIPHDIAEWTHPHLAKYLMAASLVAFGQERTGSVVLVGAPVRDAAFEPAVLEAGGGGRIGGDWIAVATGQDVRIARHGDIAGATVVPLRGASAVAADPDADRLFVGADDGSLWRFDGAALAAASPAAVRVGGIDGAVQRLWAVGDERLVARSSDGTLRLVDGASGAVLASASLPGLGSLLAVPLESRTMLVAALPQGIAELDPRTLAATLRVVLAAAPRGMDLVDGNDFGRRNRDMLAEPTLFIATDGSRVETVTVGAHGELASAGSFAMPGVVRDVRWDRPTNMVHVLGARPDGTPTLYVVEPNGRSVFADTALPFEPAVWLLDVQPHEPGLDRERALVFGASGTVAIANVGGLSFAWRFPGVVAGSLMAVCMYLLARILFRRRTVGVLLAVLLPLEGLLFAQSRIAMNDAYVGLFVVAALTLLAYLLQGGLTGRAARIAALVGLPAVGLLLGLALAAKWVGAYAVGGAILLILIRSPAGRWLALAGFVGLTAVFGWQAIAAQPPNWTFLLLMVGLTLVTAVAIVRSPKTTLGEGSTSEGEAWALPAWADPRRAFGLPFAWAIACLTLIPLAVYVLSYVPWALSAGGAPQLFGGWPAGHAGQTFLDLQVQMYRFHNELRQVHGASSPWWAWPLDLKPVWGYYETFLDRTQAMVFGAGNPVLLWLGVVGVAFGAWQAWVRRSAGLTFAVVAFLAAWLPWVRIDRFTVNYHYYVALPFALLLLAYFLAELWHGPSRRTWALARVAIVAVLAAPALLWLFAGPLCALAGVGEANPTSFVCDRPLADVIWPVWGWFVGALVVGWFVLGMRDPRRLLLAILAAAAVVFVALYPALAAWRLPNGWPLLIQGLLPTWEGSFEFTSNRLLAVSVPLLGLGPVVIGAVVIALVWWVVRAGRARTWPFGPGQRGGPPGGGWRELLGFAPRAEAITSHSTHSASPSAQLAPGARATRLLTRSASRLTGHGLWRTVVGLGFVSLATAVVAGRFSGPGGPWLWNYDLLYVDYPRAAFFHQALSTGLPLWNDAMGMGMPVYAEQMGAFYPPNWIIFRFDPLFALDVSRILHLTFAGLGAALVALRLSGSRTGAAATAAVAVLAGGIVAKLEWTNVVAAYGWLPWVLLPLAWSRSRPGPRAVALAGLFWGIQALLGHPPTWILTGLTVAAVLLARRPSPRGVGYLLGFCLLGGAVGAVQLIPTLVLTTLSTRGAGLDPDVLFRFSATPFDFLGLAFANAFAPSARPWWDANSSWYPGGFWGTVEAYAYVGLPALALAAVGLRVRRARPLLVAAAIMALIPMVAVLRPPLWDAIPGLNGLRHPVRAYMVLDLLLAVGAGLGVARLGRVRAVRASAVVVGLAVAGYAVVTASALFAPGLIADVGGNAKTAAATLTRPWPLVLEVLLGVVMVLLMRTGVSREAVRRAAVAAVALPLVLLVPGINQSQPAAAFSWADSEFMRTLVEQQPQLVLTVDQQGEVYSNQLAAAGVRDLFAFASLPLSATQDLLSSVRGSPESRLAKSIGLDTTVAFSGSCLGRLVATDRQLGASICHLDGAAHPPYWMAPDAVALSYSGGGPVTPIDADVNAVRALASAVPATVVSWDAAGALIDVNAPADGYVFIDRAWYPAWQVSVDGTPSTAYRAWGGQLVPVAAGKHRVDERFVPWDAQLGLGVTVASLLVLGLGYWLSRKRGSSFEPAPLFERARFTGVLRPADGRRPTSASSPASVRLQALSLLQSTLASARTAVVDRARAVPWPPPARPIESAVRRPPAARRTSWEHAAPAIGLIGDRWVALLLVALGVGVPLLLAAVSGALAIPHNDDWIYRRIAQQLFDTGRLDYGGVAAQVLVGLIVLAQPLLWLSHGAPWVYGIVTATLAAAATVAGYYLVRRLLPTGFALVAVASVLFFPGFLLYTTSFMTDIPAMAAATICLALGTAALSRQGPERSRFLIASLGVGVFAFSIRDFVVAAPIAVVLAAGAQEGGARRRYRPTGASLLVTCGLLYLFAANVPGRFVWPFELSSGAADHVRLAGPTLALALSPALVIAYARRWREWRVPGFLGGGLLGVLLYRGEVLQVLSGGGVPGVLVGNVLSNTGAPGSGVLAGGRPILFGSPIWELLNLVALLAVVAGFGLAGAVLGGWLRGGLRFGRAGLREWIGSPVGILVIFSVLYAAVLVAYGLVATMFDRYLWPLALPLSAVLLLPPRAPPLESSRATPGKTVRWATLGMAGLLIMALALTSLALTLNSDAFDVARWRMGDLAVSRGVPPDTVDAGMEWVGYHATGRATPDVPSSGRAMWYEEWWPSFRLCAIVSSGPIDRSGFRLEAVDVEAYRLLLFTGYQEPLYLYRVSGPGCPG